MEMTLIWITSFIVFLLIGLPIPIAMSVGVYGAIIITGKVPLQSVAVTLWSSLNSFVLAAIPLFMLIGFLMGRGDFIKKIFNFSNALVGWMTGGIGAVSIVATDIFGGISGSSTADAASLGPIEIEAMVMSGYPKDYATALAVCVSTTDILIPPSIIMVVYAILAGESAAACLVAGFIPGLVVSVGLMIINYIIARKNGWGKSENFSVLNILNRGKEGFWALISPVIIMGIIVIGWATPSEAAAITALYCLIIGFFIYKVFKLKDIPHIFMDTGRIAGVSLFLLTAASLITFILDYEKVPDLVTNTLISIFPSKTFFLLAILVFFLIIGCFIDALPALVILAPVLLPPIKALGVNPVHFGVIMVAALGIGLITPPVGICLYTLSNITKIPIGVIAKRAIPFLFMMVLTLLLITFVPALSLWLPDLLLSD